MSSSSELRGMVRYRVSCEPENNFKTCCRRHVAEGQSHTCPFLREGAPWLGPDQPPPWAPLPDVTLFSPFPLGFMTLWPKLLLWIATVTSNETKFCTGAVNGSVPPQPRSNFYVKTLTPDTTARGGGISERPPDLDEGLIVRAPAGISVLTRRGNNREPVPLSPPGRTQHMPRGGPRTRNQTSPHLNPALPRLQTEEMSLCHQSHLVYRTLPWQLGWLTLLLNGTKLKVDSPVGSMLPSTR